MFLIQCVCVCVCVCVRVRARAGACIHTREGERILKNVIDAVSTFLFVFLDKQSSMLLPL